MDAVTLKTLVVDLVVAAATLMGAGNIHASPQILQVTQKELAAKLCNRPCPVHAYFEPGKGIWLADQVNVSQDLNARSILVHEIVHFIQWQKSGRGPTGCDEWRDRERQAFIIQHRWLNGQSQYGQRNYPLARPMRSPLTCLN